LHKFIYSLATFAISLLIMISPAHTAENRLNQIHQSIDSFKQSELYSFAPQTTDRANAYLGAAMLASEQRKAEDTKIAIDQAISKLAEAQQTATTFQTRFRDLINLRQDSVAIVQIITSPGQSTG